MYKSILRPLLFHIDAEEIHDKIVKVLQFYRHLAPVRMIVRSTCHADTAGWKWRNMTFRNSVGLSAGFDKAASCFDKLGDPSIGNIAKCVAASYVASPEFCMPTSIAIAERLRRSLPVSAANFSLLISTFFLLLHVVSSRKMF